MRFECKVRVVNRNPGAKSGTFYLRSTIALGKETYSDVDYFLLHFSNIARGALRSSRYTKYRLKCNPTKVFSKCVNEGKVTISFEDPPHDLFIQGEPSMLSSFVEILTTCLAGEVGALQPSPLTIAARERYNKHLLEKNKTLLDKKETTPEEKKALPE